MRKIGLASWSGLDRTEGRSKHSEVLNKIAQSLDLPIEAFYGSARAATGDSRAVDFETERLLTMVGAHLSRLDAPARRRFGEAVAAMIDRERTDD